ncbi:MAG: hypothetical protein ABIF84_02445 [Patescibacteria group bacterium]
MPNIKRAILLLGDILILYLSLWLTLFLRYGANFNFNIWLQHFWPFTVIYFPWLVVFFIVGLYELSLARNNIRFYSLLLNALIINASLSITFFYFIPYFGITPKLIFF